MSFYKKSFVLLALFTGVITTSIYPQEKAPLLKKLIQPVNNQTSAPQKKVEKKPDQVLHKVVIKGNKEVSEKEILNEIILKQGDELNSFRIKQAVKNIQSMGIFETVTSKITNTSKGAILTITVVENQKIKEVRFEGNSIYTSERFSELIRSKSGTIFDLSYIRRDIKEIEALYHDNGYSQAKVFRVKNPTEEDPSLVFYIGEGYIESFAITGNTKTKDYVILRELDMKEGAIIQDDKMRENIRRVYNLGYFENVTPYFSPGEAPNTYKLELDIKERPTSGSFSFGGGYSPISGFSFFTDLYWDNVMGTGQLIMLKSSFGFGDNRNSSYQFKYHNPWMWDYRRSFTFRTWLTQGRFNTLTPFSTATFTPRDEQRRGFDTTIGLYHTYEFRTSHKMKYETVVLPELDPARAFNIYSYTFGVSYDSRDVRFNPTSGQYHTLAIEKSFKFRKTAIDFTKIDASVRKYIPTFKKQTIALRATGGLLTSPQIDDTDVYISEWYYVGGSNTVRGYEDTRPFANGNKQVVLNAEYRFLFTPVFQTVLFVDAGNATHGRRILDFKEYRVGKGVGLRFNIPPIGPIRLDFGIGDEDVSYIHFNVGHTF